MWSISNTYAHRWYFVVFSVWFVADPSIVQDYFTGAGSVLRLFSCTRSNLFSINEYTGSWTQNTTKLFTYPMGYTLTTFNIIHIPPVLRSFKEVWNQHWFTLDSIDNSRNRARYTGESLLRNGALSCKSGFHGANILIHDFLCDYDYYCYCCYHYYYHYYHYHNYHCHYHYHYYNYHYYYYYHYHYIQLQRFIYNEME